MGLRRTGLGFCAGSQTGREFDLETTRQHVERVVDDPGTVDDATLARGLPQQPVAGALETPTSDEEILGAIRPMRESAAGDAEITVRKIKNGSDRLANELCRLDTGGGCCTFGCCPGGHAVRPPSAFAPCGLRRAHASGV